MSALVEVLPLLRLLRAVLQPPMLLRRIRRRKRKKRRRRRVMRTWALGYLIRIVYSRGARECAKVDCMHAIQRFLFRYFLRGQALRIKQTKRRKTTDCLKLHGFFSLPL